MILIQLVRMVRDNQNLSKIKKKINIMKFKTIITYIDVDTGEVLNTTNEEFKRNYDFKKSKEKSIVKDNLCTLIYIYEGSKTKQLEMQFDNKKNSL